MACGTCFCYCGNQGNYASITTIDTDTMSLISIIYGTTGSLGNHFLYILTLCSILEC